MWFASSIGSGVRVGAVLFGVSLASIVAGGIVASSATATAGNATAVGRGEPPPEWLENAGAWPAHNHDLSNTRATTQTAINAATGSRLKIKWRFALKGSSAFGVFASSPIVLGGRVYLQDLNSNVYALDEATGKLVWKHSFNAPSIGPNGVSFGYGHIYGATESNAFALDANTGKLVWSRRLVRNDR